MSKRIDYLDAAKGIGILFVVLGHNQIKVDDPIVYQVIYSFHMPFFFLLSGMFFKTEYGFFELARRRFNSLLKPFIAYMLVVYLGSIFFTKIDLPTILGRFIKALYGGPNTLEWVPLWFLPHLFLVNLFAFLVIKFLYTRLPRLWMRLVLLAAMLGVGVATIKLFWPVDFTLMGHSIQLYGLPWSADLLLITGTFFILGYELKGTLLDFLMNPAYARWIFVGALILFAGLNIIFQSTIDFYVRGYGSYVVNTLEAICGSLSILYLAKWLEVGPARLFSAFKLLGGASIVLLIFHYVPQAFFYQKLAALNMNELLASLLAFCGGVIFPVLLYLWVIRPNPLLSGWFGLGRLQAREETVPNQNPA